MQNDLINTFCETKALDAGGVARLSASSTSLTSLQLIDTKVYESLIRALLGIAARFCAVIALKSRAVPNAGWGTRLRGGQRGAHHRRLLSQFPHKSVNLFFISTIKG